MAAVPIAAVRTSERGLVLVLLLVVAAIFLGFSQASASSERQPAPVSDWLAKQMAEDPDGTFRLMVHGTNLKAADDAVRATGMTKVTEFRRIAVVVARATVPQIEAARNEPGVTYLEGDQPLQLHG